ncbi:hypothetical protein BGX34_001193, partial [Mortierella sp. NVP85]
MSIVQMVPTTKATSLSEPMVPASEPVQATGPERHPDLKNFEFACINMVGVSNPQQPENYPQLQDEQCHFASVTAGLGDKG